MSTIKIAKKPEEELRIEKEKSIFNERKSRWGYIISMIVLSLSLLSIGVYFFWTIAPYNILEIKNNPIPVRPTTIDEDQYIILHYNYCKYGDIEGEVESTLVSKTTILPLPTSTDTTKKNCSQFDAPYPVPGQAPPEKYHYKFKACYQVNPIRRVCTEWESNEFVIQGPEIPKDIKLPESR